MAAKVLKNPVVEAAKEIARLVVLAIPGIIIGYLGKLPETETTVIVLLVLRAVDSYVHHNPNIASQGIVPF